MTLLRWWGRPAAPVPAPPAARFTVDRLRLFDAGKTRLLAELMALPRGRRDAAWTDRFFDSAWNAALVVHDPAVAAGPDGFPYVRLNLPPAGRFKPTAVANLAALCLERATGVALFASPADPVGAFQFNMPMGMLDSLLRFDTWRGDPADRGEDDAGAASLEAGWGGTVTMQAARPVTLGPPSVHYLPTYSARALLNHMRGAWGITDPRVRLMVEPGRRPSRTLVVGCTAAGLPAGADWDVHRRRLLWFLPEGRAVMPMPDDWRLEDMTPLEQLAGQAPAPAR